MGKKNYLVKRSGTYGKQGDVIELDLGGEGLTDRKKVMLSEYKNPVIKAENSSKLNSANKEIKSLKSDLADAKKEIERLKINPDKNK